MECIIIKDMFNSTNYSKAFGPHSHQISTQ